jgi:predicted branched-subunit amino acid permease
MTRNRGWEGLGDGLRDGMPLGLTYFVFAWSIGHHAVVALGFSPAYASAQSFLLFSAQGQIAALQVLSTGGGAALATLVLLFINMRFMLISAALAPYLRTAPAAQILLTAHVIGNGTMALAMRRFDSTGGQAGYLFGVGVVGFLGYGMGTTTGAYLGGALPAYLSGPAIFALPAFLVTAIVGAMSSGTGILLALALLSGSFTLAAAWIAGTNVALIAGPTIAATLCTCWKHGRR